MGRIFGNLCRAFILINIRNAELVGHFIDKIPKVESE